MSAVFFFLKKGIFLKGGSFHTRRTLMGYHLFTRVEGPGSHRRCAASQLVAGPYKIK